MWLTLKLTENRLAWNFSSAGWACKISWFKCHLCASVCLDVNQGGTNCNHCTQTCNLACMDLLMYPGHLPKTRSVWPNSGSKSPAKKVALSRQFQASWASQPMGCLLCVAHSVGALHIYVKFRKVMNPSCTSEAYLVTKCLNEALLQNTVNALQRKTYHAAKQVLHHYMSLQVGMAISKMVNCSKRQIGKNVISLLF